MRQGGLLLDVVFDLGAAVPHIIAFAVLAGIVAMMYLSGSRRSLSNVDYDRVTRPVALNRWAARRALLLPLGALANALWAGLGRPSEGALALVLVVTGVVVCTWIIVGSRRFYRPR